eukprot:2855463-Ditylum_brightwellii.AAC.1
MVAYGMSFPADFPDPPWISATSSTALPSSRPRTNIFAMIKAKLAQITASLASLADKVNDLQDLPSSNSFQQMIENTNHLWDQQCEDRLQKAKMEAAATLPLILHEIRTSIIYAIPSRVSTAGFFSFSVQMLTSNVKECVPPSADAKLAASEKKYDTAL